MLDLWVWGGAGLRVVQWGKVGLGGAGLGGPFFLPTFLLLFSDFYFLFFDLISSRLRVMPKLFANFFKILFTLLPSA